MVRGAHLNPVNLGSAPLDGIADAGSAKRRQGVELAPHQAQTYALDARSGGDGGGGLGVDGWKAHSPSVLQQAALLLRGPRSVLAVPSRTAPTPKVCDPLAALLPGMLRHVRDAPSVPASASASVAAGSAGATVASSASEAKTAAPVPVSTPAPAAAAAAAAAPSGAGGGAGRWAELAAALGGAEAVSSEAAFNKAWANPHATAAKAGAAAGAAAGAEAASAAAASVAELRYALVRSLRPRSVSRVTSGLVTDELVGKLASALHWRLAPGTAGAGAAADGATAGAGAAAGDAVQAFELLVAMSDLPRFGMSCIVLDAANKALFKETVAALDAWAVQAAATAAAAAAAAAGPEGGSKDAPAAAAAAADPAPARQAKAKRAAAGGWDSLEVEGDVGEGLIGGSISMGGGPRGKAKRKAGTEAGGGAKSARMPMAGSLPFVPAGVQEFKRRCGIF